MTPTPDRLEHVRTLADWLEQKATHAPTRIQLDEDEARLAVVALRAYGPTADALADARQELARVRGALAEMRGDMQRQLAFLAQQEADHISFDSLDSAARYSARQSVLKPYLDRLAALEPGA